MLKEFNSRSCQKRTRTAAILCSAIVGVLSYTHVAEATTFVLSTSGATALGSFNRGNSNADAPTTGTIVRGPYALGQSSIVIGSTTYTAGVGATYFGVGNPGAPLSNEPIASQDQVLYYYREAGSVNGVLDLLDSAGLLSGTPLYPNSPQANTYLWGNGTRFSAPDTAGTPVASRVIGHTDPGRMTSTNGQPFVRMAWSDVKFRQAFANNSGSPTPAFNLTPNDPGYGLGRGNIGATNFQQYRKTSTVIGGVDPTTTFMRNETIAVTPFNLVANPGTGLAEVSKSDAQWLQLTGRLQNGANFNSVTREFGSGTRNQGALNLGIDPSWAGGERDRRATAQYTTTDVNGNTITVHVGDEADPSLSLSGSVNQDPNENRTGPQVHFSDKISGGSGVRATVATARMGVGILSGGDSQSGAGFALSTDGGVNGTNNSGTNAANPMRALAVDWNNGSGNVQATVGNVTTGKYRMWSQAQAVTIAPYANPTLNDGTFTTRPILGDQRDVSGGTISTSPTSFAANGDAVDPGLHRKFIDNMINSVATANPASAQITPADFFMNGGFILPQIMAVTKDLDSDTTYGTRTADATLTNAYASGLGKVMFDKTNWANPHTTVGNVYSGLGAGPGDTGTGSTKYNIFASANNAVVGAVQNRQITISQRTYLAGDFDGDGVRDFSDTKAAALAYASPSTYLATLTVDPVVTRGWNYNGTAVASVINAGTNSTSSGTNASTQDGLIVLSDLNGNGNVTVDANDATFATAPVERADIRFFLYGATVDTSAYNAVGTATYNGGSVSLDAKANRRENGVRLGQLKKNAAIDLFNAQLDSFVDDGPAGPHTLAQTAIAGFTQVQADAKKFNKFDVNNDGVVTRADAQYVDRNVGKNYTSLNDALSTNDDLVAAELQDNNTITHTITGPGSDGTGDSDFHMIRVALGTSLRDGDGNFDGQVNTADFDVLATNFNSSGHKWSEGDYNFDGVVNALDFNAMASNYGLAPGPGPALGSLVPEPGSISLLLAGLLVARRTSRGRRRAMRPIGDANCDGE